jgi:hypothetical protein
MVVTVVSLFGILFHTDFRFSVADRSDQIKLPKYLTVSKKAVSGISGILRIHWLDFHHVAAVFQDTR